MVHVHVQCHVYGRIQLPEIGLYYTRTCTRTLSTRLGSLEHYTQCCHIKNHQILQKVTYACGA